MLLTIPHHAPRGSVARSGAGRSHQPRSAAARYVQISGAGRLANHSLIPEFNRQSWKVSEVTAIACNQGGRIHDATRGYAQIVRGSSDFLFRHS